jgi:2-oxoglutarate ferredoxin oxidoreductase subunit alpha
LFQAVWGRNGECPAIVIAPATPADCFHMAIEAVRLAFKYMSPVFYLSDGYLANGAEPWAIPEIDRLPKIEVTFATDPANFMPYARDPETLARPYASRARRDSSIASAASRSSTSPATSTTILRTTTDGEAASGKS